MINFRIFLVFLTVFLLESETKAIFKPLTERTKANNNFRKQE